MKLTNPVNVAQVLAHMRERLAQLEDGLAVTDFALGRAAELRCLLLHIEGAMGLYPVPEPTGKERTK